MVVISLKSRYVMKYLPDACFKTVFDIDFNQLTKYNALFFDLDNTLAKYSDAKPSFDIQALFKKIKALGFKIYIISNNNERRINKFCANLNIDGILTHANKPFVKKVNKYLKEQNLKNSDIVGIGDQILTDIAFYKKINVYAILVKTIDLKTQKWYTKINRLREKKIIRKIKAEFYGRGVELEKICRDA